MWPFLRKPREPLAQIRVLCLLADPRDRTVVDDVCQKNAWNVHFAAQVDEDRLLRPNIILLDRDLTESGWRESMIALAESSPGACIMLASQVMDGYLWNEVVRHGGYDVLAKPLREPDVSRALRLAWSYWSSANPPRS
jgi:FixJ family two-component response regulator